MPFNTEYPLTYDHAQCGSSNSSDFPALVYFSDPSLRDVAHGGNVQSSVGADILFFSDSGLHAQIPSEIKSYDPVNGIGWALVKIATLSHSADGSIYMGVGNPSPPSRTGGVWDSNFKGVWHLGDGVALDLSNSAGSGSPTDHGATAISGKTGGGASVVNGSSWIDLGYTPSGVTDFTLECWYKQPTPASEIMVSSRNVGTTEGMALANWNALPYGPWIIFQGPGLTRTARATVIGTDWHHVVGVHAAGSTDPLLYVDGIPYNANDQTAATNPADSGPLTIGGDPYTGFTGLVDEVRFSMSARSADWILAQFNNQNAPGNIGSPGFWTWGTAAPGPGGIIPQVMHHRRMQCS